MISVGKSEDRARPVRAQGVGPSLDVLKTMQIAPITKDAILRLMGATLAPVVPQVLTMMSLDELLKKLFGILV
jgi:hypothetical protein